MLTTRIFMASLAVSFALILVSSSAWAFTLPMIPASGEPHFRHNVTIRMNDKKGELEVKGKKDFIWSTESGSADNIMGTKANFSLKVDYNNSGDFLDGEWTVVGGIPDLGIPNKTLLASGDVIKWNVTSDPFLWGFKTDNIMCSPLLLVSCTTKESIYISFDDEFDGDFNNGTFKTSGFSVTTVPIPPAAWLFGSALVLLGWMRRKAA